MDFQALKQKDAGEKAALCECDSSCRSQTIVERMMAEKARLEKELDALNDLLADLHANPKVVEVLVKMGRHLRYM